MRLDSLVSQVRQEVKALGEFDMRTFGFIHFDYPQSKDLDMVEFFAYGKPERGNRKYLRLTYNLLDGECLCRWRISNDTPHAEKRVVGFERNGVVTFYSEEEIND